MYGINLKQSYHRYKRFNKIPPPKSRQTSKSGFSSGEAVTVGDWWGDHHTGWLNFVLLNLLSSSDFAALSHLLRWRRLWYAARRGYYPTVTNAFRNIITTAKQAVYRRNGLAKTLGAHVIIVFRVAVSRESREERALGLSPLLFFFGYFLKMQKVTKISTQTNYHFSLVTFWKRRKWQKS